MRALKDLDLNLLVLFKYLLAERSVAGAAKLLNVTPSTVSKGLAKLREWFADPLFVRGRRGLQPTNLALTLGEELELWFQLTGVITSLNRDAIPDGARFSLMVQSPFYNNLLSDLPITIHEHYPNSVVKMLAWNRHSLGDIVNGDADLGICVKVTTALCSNSAICPTTSIMKSSFATGQWSSCAEIIRCSSGSGR